MAIKLFTGNSIRTIFEYDSDIIGYSPQSQGIEDWNGILHWATNGTDGGKIIALIPMENGRYGLHDVMRPTASALTLSQATTNTNSPVLRQILTDRLITGHDDSGTHRVLILRASQSSYVTDAQISTRIISLPSRKTVAFVSVNLLRASKVFCALPS